jgi:hypothetical protein
MVAGDLCGNGNFWPIAVRNEVPDAGSDSGPDSFVTRPA